MSKGLEKLELKYFRGATTDNFSLTFDPKKIVTFIYGENGSGKSTIIDALDFICNKKLSGFDNVSGAEILDSISVGRSYNELEIIFSAFGKKWKAGKLYVNKSIAIKMNRVSKRGLIVFDLKNPWFKVIEDTK